VSCIVKRHLKNGFAVNFLNGLEGVVDWFHLPSVVSHHKEMCDLYPLNSTLKVPFLRAIRYCAYEPCFTKAKDTSL
jgi:hypothetical protein